jgi:hypothetical protein
VVGNWQPRHHLIETVRKRQKNVILQFFVPGHGKTRLDGKVFGQAGVGGAVAELLKKTRLRTTLQLKTYCEQRKMKHQSLKSSEKNSLKPWLHLLMIPGPFPSEQHHLHQKAIQSLFCWESQIMVGCKGLAPVTMWCHGVAYQRGTKIQMRIIPHAQPEQPGEYSIAKRKTGYPKEVRNGWKIAPLDVGDTPAANTQSLASQAQLLSQLSEETSTLQPNVNALTLRTSQQPKRKVVEEKDCDSKCPVKKLYSIEQKAYPHLTTFGIRSMENYKMNAEPTVPRNVVH